MNIKINIAKTLPAADAVMDAFHKVFVSTPEFSCPDDKCGPCGEKGDHEDEMLEEVANVILEDLPEDCTNLRRKDLSNLKTLISAVLEKIDELSRGFPEPRVKAQTIQVPSGEDDESRRGDFSAGRFNDPNPKTFAQAFRMNRNAGKKFFMYNRGRGVKRYHTRLKGESEGKWAKALKRARR